MKDVQPPELPSPFLDRAIESVAQDRLGHQHLAEEIVAAVEVLEAEGIVVGVQGPWGSGKSGVLNLVEKYAKGLGNPPTVVRFNPWWFSGRENLYARFFAVLASNLRVSNSASRLNTVIEGFEKLGDALGTFAKYAPSGGVKEIIQALSDASKSSKNLKRKEPSLDDTRGQLIKALKDHRKPIWVFIDDIDRLEGNEMLQMFALVRSLADFPWVTYFVAFDTEQVGRQLKEENYPDAQRYLEKVLDLNLSIPVPEPLALFAIYSETISAALSQTPTESWKQWFSDYCGLLPTVRRIRRLGHAVKVAYQLHAGEVNEEDLVGLELLRFTAPEVYHKLARAETVVIEPRFMTGGAEQLKELRENLLVSLLEGTEEASRILVEKLLTHLFPQLSARPEFIVSPTSARRISNPSTFRLYFRLGQRPVPTNLIPEILDGLEAAPDQLRDLLAGRGNQSSSQVLDPHSLLVVLTEELTWRYQSGRDLSESQVSNAVKAVGHGADGDLPEDATQIADHTGVTSISIRRLHFALAATGYLAFAKDRDSGRFASFLAAAKTLPSSVWAYYLVNNVAAELARKNDLGDPGNRLNRERIAEAEAVIRELEPRTLQALRDRLKGGVGLPYLEFFVFPVLRRVKAKADYASFLYAVRGREAEKLKSRLETIAKKSTPEPGDRDWIEPLAMSSWLKHLGGGVSATVEDMLVKL